MSSRYRRLDDAESLRRFVQNLREGIYIMTPAGEILDGNPAFLEIVGLRSLAELKGVKATDFVDPAVRKEQLLRLDRDGAVREFEIQIRRKDGQIRTVIDTAFLFTDPASREAFIHGVLVDITERKRLELQLLEQSLRDPLTGCYNRRFLGQFATRYEARPTPWGCILADIDNFKQYNDRFGHEAGDSVLTKLARFLLRQTRAEEAVVRMGGDEFLVLLPNTDEASTEKTAGRLQFVAEKEMLAPFAMGWASRHENEALEKTILRADHHMISVKGELKSPSGIWKRPA